MARRPDIRISVGEIANAQKIPVKFLEQIFQTLKSGKFVVSSKGRGGGYQLSRAAREINLAEVVRLFEGHLAPAESVSTFYYRATPVEREKKLLRVLQEVRDVTVSIMEKCSLADVV
jgi:Rrf2 family protein